MRLPDGRSSISSYEKSELVSGLAKLVVDAHAATEPNSAEKKARA